jgi:hypothetical protein
LGKFLASIFKNTFSFPISFFSRNTHNSYILMPFDIP